MNISEIEQLVLNPYMIKEVLPSPQNEETKCELYLFGKHFASTKLNFDNYNYIFMQEIIDYYQKQLFASLYDATHVDNIAAIELAAWGFDIEPEFYFESEYKEIINLIHTKKEMFESGMNTPTSNMEIRYPTTPMHLAIILGAMFGYFFPERTLELLEEYSYAPNNQK
jgi:hypothetical protein